LVHCTVSTNQPANPAVVLHLQLCDRCCSGSGGMQAHSQGCRCCPRNCPVHYVLEQFWYERIHSPAGVSPCVGVVVTQAWPITTTESDSASRVAGVDRGAPWVHHQLVEVSQPHEKHGATPLRASCSAQRAKWTRMCVGMRDSTLITQQGLASSGHKPLSANRMQTLRVQLTVRGADRAEMPTAALS
jgi:hypothetical protein